MLGDKGSGEFLIVDCRFYIVYWWMAVRFWLLKYQEMG